MRNFSTCRPYPCRNKQATKFSGREKEENNKKIKWGGKKKSNLSATLMQHHDSKRMLCFVKCQFLFFCFLFGEKCAYGRDGGFDGVREGGEQGVRGGKVRVREADGGELNSQKSLIFDPRGLYSKREQAKQSVAK